ncbi:sulfatase family protein [gamma proteobacterium NOR5-3]|nr:sulfatase family protein [gamma proteobacterium NOR5-3]
MATSATAAKPNVVLMLGRYPVRAGLGIIIIGGTPNTLQADEFTLAEMFKSRAYATGMTGKWHLESEGKAGQRDRALMSIMSV